MVFIAALGLSLVVVSGEHSLLQRGLLVALSFSCCVEWALEARASVLWLSSLVAPRQVESSPARDQTHVPCIGRRILNHWTTREVLRQFLTLLIHAVYTS